MQGPACPVYSAGRGKHHKPTHVGGGVQHGHCSYAQLAGPPGNTTLLPIARHVPTESPKLASEGACSNNAVVLLGRCYTQSPLLRSRYSFLLQVCPCSSPLFLTNQLDSNITLMLSSLSAGVRTQPQENMLQNNGRNHDNVMHLITSHPPLRSDQTQDQFQGDHNTSMCKLVARPVPHHTSHCAVPRPT